MNILLFQQEGGGMQFTFITTDRKARIDSSWDCKSIGYALFWIGEVLSGQDGDLDDMIITIPGISHCPNLVYDPITRRFVVATEQPVEGDYVPEPEYPQ